MRLTRPGAAQDAAPDGPGQVSHFGLARKDCVGTARNRTSKVWYTVADGVLSDVYYPTVDNTNVETLQFVVTDGATFTDLQARDTTSSARALDPTAEAIWIDPDLAHTATFCARYGHSLEASGNCILVRSKTGKQ